MAEDIAETSKTLDIAELNALVDEHVRNGEHKTALFWAEKRLALCAHRPLIHRLPEMARYLNVLTIASNWHMILTFCSHHELHNKHTIFTYYVANAMYNTENYHGPVTFPLNMATKQGTGAATCFEEAMEADDAKAATVTDVMAQLDAMTKELKLDSRLMLVMAKSYLMIQNRPAAKTCIRECLSGNPNSSDALHTALDAKLLTDREIKKLLTSKNKKSAGARVMNLLYELRCSRNEPTDSEVYDALNEDIAIQAATAHRLYNKGSIIEAFNITSTLYSEYGYYEDSILIHIACLVALRKHSTLFALGHKLVETMRDSHVTWYVIGCYYYTIEQYAAAKKYLEKTTSMCNGFGEGWIVYGHTLFFMEEHEQALNCFLRASRVLEGNFEPLLYIAMQNATSNNYQLAVDFMRDANAIEPNNPIVCHEQATIAFMQEDFAVAEELYRRAIRIVCRATSRESFARTLSRPCSDFWEPLFQNMGHALLCLSRYEDAIEAFRKALALGRNKAEAWANIGICLGCLGRHHEAIEALNDAALMRPDNENIKNALNVLIEHVAREPTDICIEDKTITEIIAAPRAKKPTVSSAVSRPAVFREILK